MQIHIRSALVALAALEMHVVGLLDSLNGRAATMSNPAELRPQIDLVNQIGPQIQEVRNSLNAAQTSAAAIVDFVAGNAVPVTSASVPTTSPSGPGSTFVLPHTHVTMASVDEFQHLDNTAGILPGDLLHFANHDATRVVRSVLTPRDIELTEGIDSQIGEQVTLASRPVASSGTPVSSSGPVVEDPLKQVPVPAEIGPNSLVTVSGHEGNAVVLQVIPESDSFVVQFPNEAPTTVPRSACTLVPIPASDGTNGGQNLTGGSA